MSCKWRLVLAVAVGIFILLGDVTAQVSSGVITGRVVDSQGAVIPAATVTLTQVGQKAIKVVSTNELGIYEARFLPIGPYSVEATSEGFKKLIKSDLTLEVGQTMVVDMQLEVGGVEQSIEVQAGASQALRLQTSEIGQVINHQQVADLPLNGRNFDDLIPLNAGVTTGGQGNSNSGYNLNGSRTDQNMFLIDGIDNVNSDSNLSLRPPIDAIEEFQILTSTFSAEYGRTAGGVVSVTLKSGTNDFHGSLFEFLRNEKLDANSFFDNQVPLEAGQTKAKRQPLRRNQFGGTIGGPIVKNRLFFFADYQGLREATSRSTIQSVPTERESVGDFSQSLPDGAVLYANSLLGTTYPNQRLPMSEMDPVAIELDKFYPSPNLPGVTIPGLGTLNNFSTSGSSSRDSDQFDTKLDYTLGASDNLSGHYSISDGSSLTPAAFGPVGPCIDCGVVLDLLAGSTIGRNQNIGLSEVHTFSPTTVNELRLGVNRSSSLGQTSDGNQNLADDIGLANVNVSPLTTGLPWFYFSPGPSWMGTSPFTPSRGGFTTYQVSDNLSHVRGKHSIKVGFDFRRRHSNGAGNFFGKGAYIIIPFFTGFPYGDFLTGRALVVQQDLTPGTTGLRNREYGFYGQDDFKVTRRLTLNFGLRYDLYPGHTEVANRLSNLVIETGEVIYAGVDGAPRNFVNTDRNNFAPRLGFAYAIGDKTAIRGGYGLSYFNFADAVSKSGLNPPFTRAFNTFNIGPDAEAVYRFSDGLPVDLVKSPAEYDRSNPSGSFRQVESNARAPYTQYFSLNIQRALPGNLVFDIGYVGTKGTKLPGEYEGNPAPPGDPSTTETRRVHAATIPNVGGITSFANAFSSSYHSLQAKIEKRMSNGLQFLGTYTWSKSIDDKSGSSITGGGDSNPSSVNQNPFDRASDRGLSSFDRRHRLVAAFNYDLPIGRGRALGSGWGGVANALLGGWQTNGIITLQSGLPFNVLASSAASCGCSAGELRADRIADGRLSGDKQSISGWFDKTAFIDPPSSTATQPGRYGNSGRNIIPGPGAAKVDFSIFKKFQVKEWGRLEFRAEFFNLLNRANFLFPNDANATWQAGGIITRSEPGRIGQLALKLVF